MSNKNVQVCQTTIGKAVFAKRAIDSGAEVGVVRGRVIHEEGYGSEYCIDLGNDLGLEPHAPFRYLNHSCEPNCELTIWEDEETGKLSVTVQALAYIQPGQELTIDYAWPVDAAIPCLCGTANCRGWIVASHHSLPETSKAS
ncbi:MAG: SET domain-containing protein-lysine N-methyltransferase [Planctomycetales bacterium]|nr:SET domain-containing protein-lysine N-methyltransferase [Planctomycetales bacterium]